MEVLMNELIDYRNIHDGTCLILATGESLNTLPFALVEKYPTVGVNNIQAHGYIPDYLVVIDRLDPLNKRAMGILQSKADVIFSKEPLPFANPKQVNFKTIALNVMPIEKIYARNSLFCMTTATTVALSLAMYMGFKRIGIIGFDAIDHPIEIHLNLLNACLDSVQYYANRNGIEIYNVSNNSNITAFKYLEVKEL